MDTRTLAAAIGMMEEPKAQKQEVTADMVIKEVSLVEPRRLGNPLTFQMNRKIAKYFLDSSKRIMQKPISHTIMKVA